MYWPEPKQFMFPGQQPDEKIFMVVREHWMVFLSRFLGWFGFAFALILIDWTITNYFPDLYSGILGGYIGLVRNIFELFLVLGLLMLFIIYYLNIQIITNERIVDITQNSLVNHTVSELHLSHIEDVTAEVNGFFQTFLDYGNVYVQTAGKTERFTFSKVPHPAKIEKMVSDLFEQLPEDEKAPRA